MNQTVDIKELNERIQKESSFVDMISMEMNKVIVGQKHLVESLLIRITSYNVCYTKLLREPITQKIILCKSSEFAIDIKNIMAEEETKLTITPINNMLFMLNPPRFRLKK